MSKVMQAVKKSMAAPMPCILCAKPCMHRGAYFPTRGKVILYGFCGFCRDMDSEATEQEITAQLERQLAARLN